MSIKLPPLPDWTPCMKLPVVVHVREQRAEEAHVSTREGITPVKSDDLIMRGVSGEEYPIGRAIFEQTYTLDVEAEKQGEAVPDAIAAAIKHAAAVLESDAGPQVRKATADGIRSVLKEHQHTAASK